MAPARTSIAEIVSEPTVTAQIVRAPAARSKVRPGSGTAASGTPSASSRTSELLARSSEIAARADGSSSPLKSTAETAAAATTKAAAARSAGRRVAGGASGGGGSARAGASSVRALLEDLLLEPSQLRSGLQPELLDEVGAAGAIDLQGVGLATAPVQRQHQLGP